MLIYFVPFQIMLKVIYFKLFRSMILEIYHMYMYDALQIRYIDNKNVTFG